MSDKITIQIDDAGLRAKLQSAIERLQNPSELMDLIGATLEGNIANRIDDYSADPSGAPWAPLMPSTVKRYMKKYQGQIPGRLLDRFGTSSSSKGLAGGGLRAGLTHNLIGDDAVEVGFGVPYAIFHEFGTKKMERRGLLTADPAAGTLGEYDRADVVEIVDRYLLELLD